MHTVTRKLLITGSGLSLLAASVLVSGAASATSSRASSPGITATQVSLGSIVTQTGYATADFAAYNYGVNAYFRYVNNTLHGVNGRKLVVTNALDDQSNPSTNTSDARTLVTSDHVFAIVGVASAFFSGSSYLSTSGVPTFGYATSSVWKGPSNFFADYGSVIDYASSLPDFAYVAKQVKATKIAVLAYNWPSSDAECKPAVQKLKSTYGFNVVYSNLNVPLIFANFNSDVTKMANAHVDMVISCMQGSDNVALTKLMQEHGIGKIPQVWLDGYDRSFLKNNATYMPNVYFLLQHVPFEAYGTYASTFPGLGLYFTQMEAYLKATYPTTYPSHASLQYDDVALMGWESANLFTEGLRAAGKDPTRAAVIAAINHITKDVGGPAGSGVATPTNWKIAHTGDSSPSCVAFVITAGTSTPATASFKQAFNVGHNPWVCFPLNTKANLSKPLPPPAGSPGA